MMWRNGGAKSPPPRFWSCKSNSNSLVNQLGININLILAKQEKMASNNLAN
jgi:hypothetical protein